MRRLGLSLLLLVACPLYGQLDPAAQLEGNFPLTGKLVFLNRPPAIVEVDLKNDSGDTIASTYSNPNGDFYFRGAPAGTYWLIVEDANYKYIAHQFTLRWFTDASDLRVILEPMVTPKDDSVFSKEAEELVFVNIADLGPAVSPAAIDLYWKGIDAVRSDKGTKAAEIFQNILTMAPQFYEANLQLGLQRLREHNLAEAIRLLEYAAELNPAAARPRRALGQAYFERMRYSKAIENLIEARKRGPQTADDAFYLGSSYYKLDRLKAAEDELLRCQEIARYRPGAYLQLANLYMKAHAPDKALHHLEEYLRLFPAHYMRSDISNRVKQLKTGMKKAKIKSVR